jgi:Flp pilus assembly protein TadG
VFKMTATLLDSEQCISAIEFAWQLIIPKATCIYSRLALCASYRRGTLSEKQLPGRFGGEETDRALLHIHLCCFDEWLNLGFDEQVADLRLFLSQEAVGKDLILEDWTQRASYEDVVPREIDYRERTMFCSDFRAVLRFECLQQNSNGRSETRKKSREGGFTLLTTAVCLIALTGVVGLAIDVGRMYIAKSEVQNFTDSASLAATLELDGTWQGINRALARVSSNPNKWDFVSTAITQTNTYFAQNESGPWVVSPTDPAGYRLARVVAGVDVQLTFMSAFMGTKPTLPVGPAAFLMLQSTMTVKGDSAGGQEPKNTWSEALFPFSPYAQSTTGPYFGLVPGQQYTLRWASTPKLNGNNVCAGDNQQAMIDLAQAGGGSERGFIESTSASLIRSTIVDDYQTVTRSIGDTVTMTGGAKQTQLTSLIERVNQDNDSSSLTFTQYMAGGQGTGRRIVGVPINTGSPNYTIVQIGAFFLLPASQYSNGGNSAFCAEFLGAWVQGARNQGAGSPGAYVARLIQ